MTLNDHPKTQALAADSSVAAGDPEDWTNTDIPADPYGEFMNTYHHLGDILAEYGVDGEGLLSHSGSLINRMVFTQQISALEAYLGDTLVKNIVENEDALERVLEFDLTATPALGAAN